NDHALARRLVAAPCAPREVHFLFRGQQRTEADLVEIKTGGVEDFGSDGAAGLKLLGFGGVFRGILVSRCVESQLFEVIAFDVIKRIAAWPRQLVGDIRLRIAVPGPRTRRLLLLHAGSPNASA